MLWQPLAHEWATRDREKTELDRDGLLVHKSSGNWPKGKWRSSVKYHFVYLVTKSSLFLSNEIYVSYLELLLIMVMANMGERWNSFLTLGKDEHKWTTLTQWWQVHVSSIELLTLSLTFGLVGGPFPESEQRSAPWPNHSMTFWLTRGAN